MRYNNSRSNNDNNNNPINEHIKLVSQSVTQLVSQLVSESFKVMEISILFEFIPTSLSVAVCVCV